MDRDGHRNRNGNRDIIKNGVSGPHTRCKKNYKEKFGTEHGSLDTVGKFILLGVSAFRG